MSDKMPDEIWVSTDGVYMYPSTGLKAHGSVKYTRADLAPSQAVGDDGLREINLNDEVHVKITSYGIECINKNHKELYGESADKFKVYYPVPDENGWCRLQIWTMAKMFGQYISNGGQMPIETYVKIKHPPCAGDVGEALEGLRKAGSLLPQRIQGLHYRQYEIVKAALTAQSVNGQMLEALKEVPMVYRPARNKTIPDLTKREHVCEFQSQIVAHNATPASDVGEAHTHKDFIVMPRKGHSELHEAMADACIRSIPQLESIYDSLPKEAANDFALELWNYMEPIYAAAIKEVDELHGYKYYSALNYTQSPDVGQLLKALKAKVNDALSMAETLGFYGELEKKALVAEYLITAIAAAEKAQGE